MDWHISLAVYKIKVESVNIEVLSGATNLQREIPSILSCSGVPQKKVDDVAMVMAYLRFPPEPKKACSQTHVFRLKVAKESAK
jgi:hypothetical protein